MMRRVKKIPRPAQASPADVEAATIAELNAIGDACSDLGWAIILIKEIVKKSIDDRATIEHMRKDITRLQAEVVDVEARVKVLHERGMGLDVREMNADMRAWRAAALAAGHPSGTNPMARRDPAAHHFIATETHWRDARAMNVWREDICAVCGRARIGHQ